MAGSERYKRYVTKLHSPRTAVRGLMCYSQYRTRNLPAFAKTVAEEVVQVRDVVNLVASLLPVVFNAAELDHVIIEDDVAGPPVAVARLADRADVAERLAAVELVCEFHFFRA